MFRSCLPTVGNPFRVFTRAKCPNVGDRPITTSFAEQKLTTVALRALYNSRSLTAVLDDETLNAEQLDYFSQLVETQANSSVSGWCSEISQEHDQGNKSFFVVKLESSSGLAGVMRIAEGEKTPTAYASKISLSAQCPDVLNGLSFCDQLPWGSDVTGATFFEAIKGPSPIAEIKNFAVVDSRSRNDSDVSFSGPPVNLWIALVGDPTSQFELMIDYLIQKDPDQIVLAAVCNRVTNLIQTIFPGLDPIATSVDWDTWNGHSHQLFLCPVGLLHDLTVAGKRTSASKLSQEVSDAFFPKNQNRP